jgi:hypothetical protein
MNSLHQFRDFASEAFKLVVEAKHPCENRSELVKRFDNLLDMAMDMLETKETTHQHNAISHSFADELITRSMPLPPGLFPSSPYGTDPKGSVHPTTPVFGSSAPITKDINIKETNEPTLIIHETAPSVSVIKLNSEACPFPYENDPPQFASLFHNPFASSEIIPDGTVDDDVNSEDVGVDAETGEDMDAKDLEEMEIVEFEGKRYFRGIVSNDVHVIIGDEEAGECVGTYQNGKVVLQ